MPNRSKMRRHARTGVSVITVTAFVVLIVSKWAALTTSFHRLGHTHWSWILVALALETASMASFAMMQRRLLRVGGTPVGTRPIVATTIAANALSVSVPAAGPEIGTAFTFRRFKKHGADTSLASSALLVGGLVSWVGAILVLAAGGALSGNALVAGLAAFAGVLIVATSAAVRVAVGRSRLPPRLEQAAAWLVGRISRLISHPLENPSESIRGWIKGLGSLRLSRSEWSKVGGLGLANWLTDAGVLAVAILAIGAPVPWHALLLVYGLATVVGSLGITPGGVGLVEGTLCLGLVSTGLPAALALAAVLLYRLVSFWLVLIVGWLVLLCLRLERPARALSIQGHVAL
jgi:putative heme transporter